MAGAARWAVRWVRLANSVAAADTGGASPADLDSYVTTKTMDGLFTVIGEQEKSIRENPAARSTDLLKKVFGGR